MESKLALEGIRVIDLTQHGAAPMTASLLAQWGAEVIHIEPPLTGDAARGFQQGGLKMATPASMAVLATKGTSTTESSKKVPGV